jgi:menaquinone-dependent protoporphyrinogen oxidase
MRVLVAVASKHGSTREIADKIGEVLRARGLETDVRSVEEVNSCNGYDAAVLGSAVYFGRWMKAAREFADHESAALASIPVWLFSSGPIGAASSKPEDRADRRDGDEIAKTVGAREHRVFAGKVDSHGLNPVERVAVRIAKAPYDDFRPWPEIEAWAGNIADALVSTEREHVDERGGR